MNKCKSFTSYSSFGLEDEINNFFENADDIIEVISISHAVDQDEGGNYKYSALLIYKSNKVV